MIKKILLIFSVFIIPFLSHGQTELYTQSGYTSLIIKFSGKYPKDKPISTPMLSNPLLTEKPTDFHVINDSTMFMSYYTFGPTLFYFFYNQDYCRSKLLPNHSDVLNIHYTDSTQYSMRYEGTFKEEFDLSKEYGVMISEALFTGPYFPKPEPETYQTANEYRDDVLKENERMINAVTKDISSEFIKKVFRYDMESTTQKKILIR